MLSRDELTVILKELDPELKGDMPDYFWNKYKGIAAALGDAEALRLVKEACQKAYAMFQDRNN